jgi:hypothetical protein
MLHQRMGAEKTDQDEQRFGQCRSIVDERNIGFRRKKYRSNGMGGQAKRFAEFFHQGIYDAGEYPTP